MALLFLSKGRRPIVMAKLKYGDGDDWNQHRRDAAHLTAYTEEAWDLGLTWQVMDPATATVEDLLQAPVLYISGSQAPQLVAARARSSATTSTAADSSSPRPAAAIRSASTPAFAS